MKQCPVCNTSYQDEQPTCPTDGAVLVATGSTEWQPGTLIRGKYRVLATLGRGGMGIVYKVQHITLEEYRALKVMFPQFAAEAKFRQRFLREARETRKLRNTPHVVTVEDQEQAEDGSLYIVMEYVDGISLRELLRRSKGPLPIARAFSIVRGMGEGLQAAHALGIVHRDIKPDNVMVTRDPSGRDLIKVADFGIMALKESSTALSSGPLMTAPYAAPEQWKGTPGAELDGRTDLYAVGNTLYEMLTGRLPFQSETPVGWMHAHMMLEPPPPSKFRPELAEMPGVDELLLKLLSKERENRPADAQAFLAQLNYIESQAPWGQSGGGPGMTGNPTMPMRGNAMPAPGSGRMETPAQYGTRAATSHQTGPRTTAGGDGTAKRVVLLYKRNAQPDEALLAFLEAQLPGQGYSVFIDRHLRLGTEWLLEIERQVRAADVVVPLVSTASLASEMFEWEVETAHRAAQERHGKPYLVPIRVSLEGPLAGPLGSILDPIQYTMWTGSEDNPRLLEEVLASLRNPPNRREVRIEPAGGAVPLDSEFYVVRPTDAEFRDAVERRDSIVLVKGARQMGKTSLLARGLNQARQAGSKVLLTDFQKLNESDLQSVETFFRALAELIAEKLELDVEPGSVWKAEKAANTNFERFLRREVLKKLGAPLVWGMDEVDRLFNCDFATDVFGLIRSWHNERSLDPEGPWKDLTICIVYATEANLFIKDPNQSPFNVGTKLSLSDFDRKQVAELNTRYGRPLANDAELGQFFEVVGGSPYLVRRGLQELKRPDMSLSRFIEEADGDDGPFGDHLRRILVMLAKNPALCEAVKRVMNGEREISMDDFVRLRSAGVVSGESAKEVQPRCRLYASFLKRHMC